MGLDIFAAGKLERVGDVDWDEEGINIVSDEFDYCDLDNGLYESTGEYYSFRAGSYSTYNNFRRLLSLAANGMLDSDVWESPDTSASLPFYYIINFSDCEGTIGPSVSEILHTQFVENRERVIRNLKGEPDLSKETEDPLAFELEFDNIPTLDEDTLEYFIRVYDDFTNAFRIAKDDGIVRYC